MRDPGHLRDHHLSGSPGSRGETFRRHHTDVSPRKRPSRDGAGPASARTDVARPAAAVQNRPRLDRQIAREPGDVPPERPHRQPAGRRAAAVADAILHPSLRSLVAEAAVQFDQDALLHISDVVELVRVTSWRELAGASR